MKFAAQPVNLEGNGGSPLRVSIALSQAPASSAGATFAIWAARLPDPLSPAALQALACGSFDLAAFGPIRQDGPQSGLRQATALAVEYGLNGLATVEGSLFCTATDMPPRTSNGPSWDVEFQPLKERSDGPWLLAVTACLPDQSVQVALGGLSQWAGQEHLAGVFLGPSQLAPEVEIGLWLESTLRALKPVLDFRMAQVEEGQDLSLKRVAFTEENPQDDWPALYIIPEKEDDSADGIAAPDRRDVKPTFTIRATAYGDDPAAKVRALTQLMGSLKQLLNTRKLREAKLPSGLMFNLAFATEMNFGKTEDSWDSASELTWQCTIIQTGYF